MFNFKSLKSSTLSLLLLFLVSLLLWQYIHIRRLTLKASDDDYIIFEGLDRDYLTYNKSDDNEPSKIKVLCWNIQGLELKETLVKRTLAICDIINKEKPSIVFLQEVLPETVSILRRNCKTYDLVLGGDAFYFTAILLRKGHVRHEKMERVPFPKSTMMRNLLVVQCTVKGVRLELVTSHLETDDYWSEERRHQLTTAFTRMRRADENRTIIFGGDLNLWDEELASIGGIPSGIFDVWEKNGSSQDTKYTWDMEINDNDTVESGPLRFDRLYFRPSTSADLDLMGFRLVGTHRLPFGQFPSDHWGLVAQFGKVEKPSPTNSTSASP